MSVDKNSDERTDEKVGEPFLSRWARVKQDTLAEEKAALNKLAPSAPVEVQVQNPSSGAPLLAKSPEEARPEPSLPVTTKPVVLPSLDTMTPQSDFSPFMSPNVDPQLRNLAMKKLFTDPHYNVMDRLDIYIDDYSVHTPLPLEVIRQMSIAKTLGLFDDEEKDADVVALDTTPQIVPAVEVPVAIPTPPADAATSVGANTALDANLAQKPTSV